MDILLETYGALIAGLLLFFILDVDHRSKVLHCLSRYL